MAILVLLVLLGSVSPLAGATLTEADTVDSDQEFVESASTATEGRAAVDERAGQAQVDSDIVVSDEFRLTPEEPGQIDVRREYSLPDTVTELRTRIPEGATNVRTERFSKTSDTDDFSDIGGGIYEWSGSESGGTITFTLPANKSGVSRGPESGTGHLRFADTGDWALVERPRSREIRYRYQVSDSTDEPSIVYRNDTAGPGVVGESMLFLGPVETYEWEAQGQHFRLAVPDASTLVESRSTIAETVSRAADQLRVGDRDDRVLLIAAPTSVPWGARGIQRGESDFYVLANQTIDDPSNVWLHEYVHTRQDGNWTDQTRWFVEASAEYYAALLTLEQGRIGFDEFRDHLARGEQDRFDDVILADPTTWQSNAGDYVKGALVAGAIDRDMRAATEGGMRLQDVLGRANGQAGLFDQQSLRESIEPVANDTVLDRVQKFTQSSARPGLWSAETHQDVFGSTPAIFRYDLPEPGRDGFRVFGPYRNGRLDRPVLVPGEGLALDVGVRNVGGADGSYEMDVSVNNATVETRSGHLEPGAERVETVEVPVDEVGSLEITVDGVTRTIQVREPATPRVSSMRSNRSTVQPGEPLEIVANVTNPADRPAIGTVEIIRDGTTVKAETVSLAPEERTQIVVSTTLSEKGTHQFSAGDLSVAISVEEESVGDTIQDTVGSFGAGFGPGIALVAVALLALLGRRRANN